MNYDIFNHGTLVCVLVGARETTLVVLLQILVQMYMMNEIKKSMT